MNDELAFALLLKNQVRARSQGLASIRLHSQQFSSLERYDSLEAFDVIVAWTRARFAYARVKTAVFGVSGGVDSTLTGCVLSAALGAKNVRAYTLPCESKSTDERDANALCAALGISVTRLDLTPALNAMRQIVSPSKHATSDGNLKTRLRTATLFHEAQAHNALFVGTGDLDEGFVGYYTKGSGADISPLGSLHKNEVRSLVKVSLSKFDKQLATRLAKKPADAGLIAGRTAEADLGVSYNKMQAALELIFETCVLFEGGVVPREVDDFALALKRSKVSIETFQKVADLIAASRHKASGAPVLWRRDTTRAGTRDFESE